MIVIIIASLVPLAFKETLLAFEIIDWICVGIFVIDYILRWITADYKYDKKKEITLHRLQRFAVAL